MSGESEGPSTTALSAGLSLVGVVLGIELYFNEQPPIENLVEWGIFIGLSLVLPASLHVGHRLMRSQPAKGRWFIEFWAAAPVLASAWSTVIIIWCMRLFPVESFATAFRLDLEGAKDVRELLIGAITALIAAGITNQFSKGDGALRVSSQFKSALAEASRDIPAYVDGNNTIPYDAANSNSIPKHGPIGWNFWDRGTRAKIIENHRKTHRKKIGGTSGPSN